MKRSTVDFERNEMFAEINMLCHDDTYSVFGRIYTEVYVRESCYDTYTGSSEDYYCNWN